MNKDSFERRRQRKIFVVQKSIDEGEVWEISRFIL